jgi:general secretion pathway protein G
VLVILTLLAGLVGPKVLDQLGGAKSKTARVQIAEIEQSLDLFKLDVGRYPNDVEGLRALTERPATAQGWNGPYLKKGLPADPWGAVYQYKNPGRNNAPDIFSLGADGKPGGDGESSDVYN